MNDAYRLVFEKSPHPAWVYDRETLAFLAVNDAALKQYGYSREEFLALTARDVRPPDEVQAFLKHQEDTHGEVYNAGIWRHRRRDGSIFEVEVVTSELVFEGRPGRFVMAQDITARRCAEYALRESEASLARAQRIAHLGSWEFEVESGRLRWSEEVYRIFQLDPAVPATLEQFSERVHPDDLQSLRAAVDAAAASGKPYNLEHRLLFPDGSVRHVREHAEVVYDGAITRMLGTVQDITGHKRLEEQLRQAQRMEAVGRLAGGVAHDFNNLLTIIGGYTELLAAQLDRQSAAAHDLDEIARAAERAAALTRQLLAFSRRQILQLKVMDLNTVVADLDKMLRRLIGEDIELRTVLEPNLGPVKADPTQIEQVVMNLAVNARDAMPGGGRLLIETANVDLDHHYVRDHPEVQPGPHVMLAVSDGGIGMTPETMRHIFEPFFTTKSRDKGTGLGLSTVYGIIKQSGGSVFVYSEPGRGTTFKIYLPRVERMIVPVQAPLTAAAARGHETVLVVEDEEGVRALVRVILEKHGYRVIEASRGKEALELLEGTAANARLMITDVVMPEMSGRELAMLAAERARGLQVLFISGYTDEAIVHHGVLEPGIPFLQKPFTHDALTRKVRELLDNSETAAAV